MTTTDNGRILSIALRTLNALGLGCQIIGPDDRCVFVNEVAARYGQRTVDALIGHNVVEACPGIETTEMYQRVRRCRESLTADEMDTDFELSNGQRRWVRLYLQPVPDGTCIVSIDITEQRAAHEAARRALDASQRLVDNAAMLKIEERPHIAQRTESDGRLAGRVAHDLNNVLSVILGNAGFILDAVAPDSPIHDDAREIVNAGKRAVALTQQLLPGSTLPSTKPQGFEVNSVISQMDNMLRRLLGRDVDLRIQLDPDAGRVDVDPAQIEQVLIHLVGNARDAMPRGGRLTIATAAVAIGADDARPRMNVVPGPYVRISVSDTGCGMDASTKSKLVELFCTTGEPGSFRGSGLATVMGIVQPSGGAVWVDSEAGVGSAFTIDLPNVVPPQQKQALTSTVRAAQRPAETVLVVEDESAVRVAALRVLAAAGYQVLSASSASDAIDIVKHHRETIALVLTDVVMPTMSGPEMIAILRQSGPQIRVLYMSGYSDQAIAEKHDAGFVGHVLNKPFGADELKSAVRAAMDDENRP